MPSYINKMITNNTITPHDVAQSRMDGTVLFLMVVANAINIMAIASVLMKRYGNKPLTNEVRWRPVGWYQDQHLYQRTYPSGKNAWRFTAEDGTWVYPKRTDVIYWGRRMDNETPLLAAE
jgi:hypothetical protein